MVPGAPPFTSAVSPYIFGSPVLIFRIPVYEIVLFLPEIYQMLFWLYTSNLGDRFTGVFTLPGVQEGDSRGSNADLEAGS